MRTFVRCLNAMAAGWNLTGAVIAATEGRWALVGWLMLLVALNGSYLLWSYTYGAEA